MGEGKGELGQDDNKGVIVMGANCLIRMINDVSHPRGLAVLEERPWPLARDQTHASCCARSAPQTACKMLGFSKVEVVGKSINAIIPQPFAKHHNAYVRNYIGERLAPSPRRNADPAGAQLTRRNAAAAHALWCAETGQSKVLDKVREFVVLHKERHMLPITVSRHPPWRRMPTEAVGVRAPVQTTAVWSARGAHWSRSS